MIAEVVVDIAASSTDRIFDYLCPDGIEAGRRVLVPFGKNRVQGFVIGFKERSSFSGQLKKIIRPLDDFVAVKPEMLEMMREFSSSRNLRFIDLLRLFLPAGLRGGTVRPVFTDFCRAAGDPEELSAGLSSRAARQRECLLFIGKGEIAKSRLIELFGRSSLDALVKKGLVEVRRLRRRRIPQSMSGDVFRPVLNADQRKAVEAITSGKGGVYLLHGVTGSGKTEVYMHCIEKALGEGRTAIMLVPEISLTPQVSGLLRQRFGDGVAILHSGLTPGERLDEWQRLERGEARVAVGARSAVFAPVRDVGVIIIDEEHDGSYVSESNPRYDTHEFAEFRARYNGCPLVLGSATPSVGTYKKAEDGEYVLLELPDRVNNLTLPEMETVDMSAELRMGNRSPFSVRLQELLKQTLERGEQALIFLNRRGYASFVMCRDCGYIPKCEDCDVSLTYHRTEGLMKCHYCGRTYPAITKCPVCGGTDLRQGRMGTERVVQAVKDLIPGVRVLRMDNDTTTAKGSHRRILEEFSSGNADVLVGTQMIAKGHDFRNVSLVGILDADFSLYLSDYRSNERTFQLITQVAGRAGRTGEGGRVVIQSYTPRHFVFRYACAYDYRGFYEKEKNTRAVTKFPPFTIILRILISSSEDRLAQDAAREINERMRKVLLSNPDDFVYYKGSKAPVPRIQNKYRYQIMMRIRPANSGEILPEIYAAAKIPVKRDLTVFTELDPQNLL